VKTLSVRQPYAWLIVAGFKTIENRTWRTNYRGPLQIHSSQKLDAGEIAKIEAAFGIVIDRKALHRGGIVGRVTLADVVTSSSSPWFTGPFGWVLKEPRVLPFEPWRGARGLFEAPEF
jgi:ASCH domain